MTDSTDLMDSRGHVAGCPEFEVVPEVDPNKTHMDLFCDCHDWDRPRLLSNGTDIAWPAGWQEKQADEWRLRNDLARPSEPGAGP